MTGIAIKDIPAALVEKLPVENKKLYTDDDMVAKYCAEHGNAIINQIGEVRLTLRREKLAWIIYRQIAPYHAEYDFMQHYGDCPNDDACHAFKLADAIIADLPALIEVVKPTTRKGS